MQNERLASPINCHHPHKSRCWVGAVTNRCTAVLEPPNRAPLTARQPATPADMWALLITSDGVTAPFMEASAHLSYEEWSAHISIPAWVSLESPSLCWWALLLPRDCRCDLGQLCRLRALIDIPHPSHNCMIQQCPQLQMQRAVRQ